MDELAARQVKITDAFWEPRLALNAQAAIFHQWDQLEKTGCIDNFRIAAGEKEGFREGYFFADSDAYKWLDAASRIYAIYPNPDLAVRMDSFIALLQRAQSPDGYLFTFNQIHFPGQRWVNLQIEHELYCHGHLIEAGVSHFEATGRRELLDVCLRAADLLVRDFLNATNDKTCGHEEIEIALLRLYRITRKDQYLELAQQFIERRGRIPLFPLHMLSQFRRYTRRMKHVSEQRKAYIAEHPQHASFRLPGGNYAKRPRYSRMRWYWNALRGYYAQQHAPVQRQTTPEGHSVRFGYLEAAIAMLLRSRPDPVLLNVLEQAWERMVTRRIYVTGGLGSAPQIEGFGGDFDLDPEYAYNETCASIASLLWNWEMTLLTKGARYSDLFEWQLYNATTVGMGANGDRYLYNNPLEVHGGVARKEWYAVPCCPSNLSRTFADLGKYIVSFEDDELWIHQWISSETTVDTGIPVKIKIESGLPWLGRVRVYIEPAQERSLTLHMRIPSWSSPGAPGGAASGFDPRLARYEVVQRVWPRDGESLELDFDMSIKLRRAHPRVRGHAGKVAVTRGPLVYCLESIDNPGIDIFSARLDTSTLREEFVPDRRGGSVVIHGQTIDGSPLKLVPYFSWANRGASQMVVWIRCD